MTQKPLPLPEDVAHQLERLLNYFRPDQGDPTYMVLKAHLLMEEVMYEYLESSVARPEHLKDARLSFSQLLALSRANHRFSSNDWWGWQALQKLNSIRNDLAHQLEPTKLKQKIVEFTLWVSTSITKSNKEIEAEYIRLGEAGVHPFALSLVALHVAITVTLGYSPEKRRAFLQSLESSQ